MTQPIGFYREDLAGAEEDLADCERLLEGAKQDVSYWQRRATEAAAKVDKLRKSIDNKQVSA